MFVRQNKTSDNVIDHVKIIGRLNDNGCSLTFESRSDLRARIDTLDKHKYAYLLKNLVPNNNVIVHTL